jgi:hypothetical protein
LIPEERERERGKSEGEGKGREERGWGKSNEKRLKYYAILKTGDKLMN